MVKKWIFWINCSIAGALGVLLSLSAILFFIQPKEVVMADVNLVKRTLPSSSFALDKSAYNTIGKGSCDLKYTPLCLQLPDLRPHLQYFGKNGRPDADSDHPVLNLAFNGSSTPTPINVGEKIYFYYDRKKNPPQYQFSPQNKETPLWLEASTLENEALVKVFMKNENGEVIKEPLSHAQLRLMEKEGVKVSSKPWEMGSWRVDGSLLARQKGRWMGPDKFLETHGGEDFKELKGKQRIEFTDEEENYSVYVSMGETLIFNKNRWHVVKPGINSLDFPLMVVKKIEDRIMSFELWDVGGKNKVILNLIKSQEPWSTQNLTHFFKFLGARTRTQYIFEIEGQRVLISPKDWLLKTTEGWIKMTTSKEIDDYVNRGVTGLLFVFNGIANHDDKVFLAGQVYNSSRTETQDIEIPIQHNQAKSVKKEIKEDVEEEDDDDSEEEEDDDDEDEKEDRRALSIPTQPKSIRSHGK